MPTEIEIRLTPEELQLLTYALGFAAGGAEREQRQLRSALFDLADRVHANDPNWKPYNTSAAPPTEH